ncbi:MAG: hypothetical protein RLY15_339, partial [Bacteroidota bacterium]
EDYQQKTTSNKVQVKYVHFKVTIDQINIFQNSPPPKII